MWHSWKKIGIFFFVLGLSFCRSPEPVKIETISPYILQNDLQGILDEKTLKIESLESTFQENQESVLFLLLQTLEDRPLEDTIRWLSWALEKKAPLNAINADGLTLIQWAMLQKNPKMLTIVKFLWNAGADWKFGRNMVDVIAESQSPYIYLYTYMLLEQGFPLYTQNADGRNLLHQSILHIQDNIALVDTIYYLLSISYQVDITDHFGYTALAYSLPYPDIFLAILEKKPELICLKHMETQESLWSMIQKNRSKNVALNKIWIQLESKGWLPKNDCAEESIF